MAHGLHGTIAHIVTRGYGNGTLTGQIALVVTRGYGVGVAALNLIDNDDTPTAVTLNASADTPTAANLIDNDDTPTAVTLN